MKIVGLFILALELVALALQLKNECRRNNFTYTNIKNRVFNMLRKKPLRKSKFERINLFKRGGKK